VHTERCIVALRGQPLQSNHRMLPQPGYHPRVGIATEPQPDHIPHTLIARCRRGLWCFRLFTKAYGATVVFLLRFQPTCQGSHTMENLPDHGQSLVQYVNRSLEVEENFHFLRFEFLHRLNIVDLEVKLARMKSHTRRTGTANPTQLLQLDQTLRSYGKSIIADGFRSQLVPGTASVLTYAVKLPRSGITSTSDGTRV
jgi:hypothetical protein